MAIKDDGVWSIAVMWVMTVIVLAFTVLRVYTRAFVVKSFGGDDHVYVFSFFCFLMYATFVSIAGTHGYGQDMVVVAQQPDEMKKAIIYLAVGQTFAMVGMALAKWSLGLFLLRLVESAWHKASIWMTLALLAIASILSTFVFWFQCSPPQAMWNRQLPGAKCEVPQLPFFYFLGATCAFADLFFAIVPWFFMWNLQMNKREKLIILISLSLGVIAAAFGFKRCTEIYKLVGQNFLKDVVSIIIWAAAEIAVTMVCIGIPICRPLYKDYLSRLSSRDTSKYKGLSGGREGGTRGAASGSGGSVPLRTIGGSVSARGDAKRTDSGLAGGTTTTVSKVFYIGEGGSDEEILDPAYRPSKYSPPGEERAIRVTEEYEVTSTSKV